MLLLSFLFVCLFDCSDMGCECKTKKNGHLVNLAVHLNLFVWKLIF